MKFKYIYNEPMRTSINNESVVCVKDMIVDSNKHLNPKYFELIKEDENETKNNKVKITKHKNKKRRI